MKESEPLHDLSDVTFDEMYEELRKRYAALVMVAEKEAPGQGRETQTWTYYKGSLSHAIGLCEYAKNRLTWEQQDNREEQADTPDEEH